MALLRGSSGVSPPARRQLRCSSVAGTHPTPSSRLPADELDGETYPLTNLGAAPLALERWDIHFAHVPVSRIAVVVMRRRGSAKAEALRQRGVDIAALHERYPDIGWHSFEDWARAQDFAAALTQ